MNKVPVMPDQQKNLSAEQGSQQHETAHHTGARDNDDMDRVYQELDRLFKEYWRDGERRKMASQGKALPQRTGLKIPPRKNPQ
jgi:hypothetical protein